MTSPWYRERSDRDSETITIDWAFCTEPVTVSEFDGLAEAIRAVEPDIPVTPSTHPGPDLDADPAGLEPTGRGATAFSPR